MIRFIWRILARLSLPVVGLIGLIIFGTVSFSYTEGISLFDGLYWTITVLSTVGFGDITPRTFMGKIIFMVLIIFGLSLFGYLVTSISSLLTEERIIRGIFRYMAPDGGGLRNHIIIYGWDNKLKYAYNELRSNNSEVLIVVDNDEEARRLSMEGYNVVSGKLDDERLLKNINFSKARAVILSSRDEASMILSILKIRKYNKSIDIIVASDEEELKDIYRQAGATRIINSSELIGRMLANSVFEPYSAEIALDLLSRGGIDLMDINLSSRWDGKRIGELYDSGVGSNIIAVYRGGEKYVLPGNEFIVKAGDRLVLMGFSRVIDRDRELLEG